MKFHARRSQLITVAHVALLFAVVAAFSGAKVAAIFILAGALGYLNAFAAFRALLAISRRRQASRKTALLVAIAATGTIALAWLGYWAPLALCTFSWIIIDAVVLRFKGPPVGTSASGP